MGKYSKAKMFNSKAARRQSKADEILKALDIQPGQTIADLGSGGGFFTFLFSQLVGRNGTVYALDTNQGLLEFITTQATKQGLTNITTVQITEPSLLLPSHSIDLFFVRNVYHHLQNRTRYFSELQHLLTAQGRIAIIEYSQQGSRLSFHRRCGHNVPKETIIEEMSNAGYEASVSFDFLPVQSFTVFTPKL
ncbi:MAG: methyltransferase domain-containing protein [Candidatus Thermoplasmatota archaeon]|nr:methyltransferase domain-containing protein [Candidatus Thermoplasmatota archaeon]